MYVAFFFLFHQTLGEAPEDVARDLEEELNDGRFDLPFAEQVTFPPPPPHFSFPFYFIILQVRSLRLVPMAASSSKHLYRCSSFFFRSPVCFLGNKEFHFSLHSCPIVSLHWYFDVHS